MGRNTGGLAAAATGRFEPAKVWRWVRGGVVEHVIRVWLRVSRQGGL